MLWATFSPWDLETSSFFGTTLLAIDFLLPLLFLSELFFTPLAETLLDCKLLLSRGIVTRSAFSSPLVYSLPLLSSYTSTGDMSLLILADSSLMLVSSLWASAVRPTLLVMIKGDSISLASASDAILIWSFDLSWIRFLVLNGAEILAFD